MALARKIIRNAEEAAGGTLLVLLCLTVAAQVFSRFILGQQFTWTEEVARLLFIWTSFAGAAVALKHHRHFAIELLALRLAARGGACATASLWTRRAAAAMVTSLLLVLVWQGLVHTWSVRATSTDILEISVAWLYLPLPLSCLVMALRSLPMVVSPPVPERVPTSLHYSPDGTNSRLPK